MSDVNEILVSADGQDITITIGDYSDADARASLSVVDSGGDGSLAYNNTTGVFTYTGPSASEVRAHFTAGTGISIASGVITNTRADTNTTYTQDASSTTGGANLNLVGSDSTTDTVKFASGTGMTVSQTDASTINIATTITQYTDTLARQSISVATNTGDGDLTYNNTNGQFSYTGPGNTEYRAAIGVSNASGDGSLSYSTGTGVITYAGPTNANYRGAVSAANTGTGYGTLSYTTGTGVFSFAKVTDANIRGAISVTDAGGDGSLAYDSGTGVITYNGPTASNYRAAISVTESGTGYGGIAYDPGTGVITFTGVTGSDIRTEVVDGRNLTYASTTLNLDKSLLDVNSVTAEIANDLTVTGDSLVINTRDVSTASKTLTIGSEGYNFDLNDTGDSTTRMSIVSVGTFSKTLYSMLLMGDTTTGSNQITNAMIIDNQSILDSGNPLSWNTYNMAGYPFIEATLALGDIFPAGTTITSVSVDPGDNTLATLTMSANALQTITLDFAPDYAYLSHVARSDDWTTTVLVDGFNGSGYTANTITRTLASTGVASPFLVTNNTGYVDAASAITDNFTWTTTGTVITAGARRVIDVAPTNTINEHVRVPFSLGVGPGAISTNRGLPSDKADTIGINLLNNGKIEGYTGKTIFNLTQYKNNSTFSNINTASPQERAGPQFTFNTFAGNTDTANASLYLTSGDGMGSITWFAQPATSSLVSSTFTPASISAKATETHDTSTKQGTGLYLQYTPNSNGANAAPRTFVRAEDATTEVLAKTTLKLGKISTATNTTARGLGATAASDWVTINDSAVAVNTGLRITGGLRTYGEFCYLGGQITPVAANTVYEFPLDTTNASSGTSISNTSRINISRSGFYKIIMSLQASQTVNSVAGMDFWLRKNGTDVVASATQVDLLKDQKAVVAMDWLVESDGDDYFEIVYAVGNTSVVFPYYAAQSSPFVRPAISPIIVNVIPIGA